MKSQAALPRRPKAPRQLGLPLRTWGGKRKGAGRKPKGARAGVPHRARPLLASRFPVHVTLRMTAEVYNLRSRRSYRVLERAFFAGAARFAMRLCEFSVQGNHIHMLLEAADRVALWRGIKGLEVRIARGLNRMMGRQGRVLEDRYHAHILKTPSEVRRACAYVRDNRRRHLATRGERLAPGYVDPYWLRGSADERLPAPRTWLLRQALRRPENGASDAGCTQAAPP